MSAGRRYGLVGRNGIGKTTMLRMISRLVAHSGIFTARISSTHSEGYAFTVSVFPNVHMGGAG